MISKIKTLFFFLLFMNAATGTFIFFKTGVTPIANLLGMLFAAIGLSIIDGAQHKDE
jgi:hypothetical protein